MFTINKTTKLTQINEKLYTQFTVSFNEETVYEDIEANFGVSISDADFSEESDNTKILLQYDGRYAAVTWDETPTDNQVSEVSEFIFGSKCYVEVIVQLVQTFTCTDHFGGTFAHEAVISEEMESTVFANDGYRNTRTLLDSQHNIMHIVTELNDSIIDSL